jgi:UDP-2-acetamido-3-amino-2,3-dideoxy-glucuronate N-acetyltransferase
MPNIHPTALCQSAKIAPGATIGPYCVIERGAVVEDGAVITSHAFVGENSRIGSKSLIGAGARIGAGCILDRDVTVGANAVIADNVHLHISASVTPGTKVTNAVPPYAIVSGVEGTITGYVDAASDALPNVAAPTHEGSRESRVRGVGLYEMREFPDLRGALLVGEFGTELPFVPVRYFLVYDVLSERTRGEHAHKTCHQFLTCIQGACSVLADDGTNRQEFRLDRRNIGVHLPPMTWGVQYKYTRDAVLLVFASTHYDPDDYIRDYAEFSKMAARNLKASSG